MKGDLVLRIIFSFMIPFLLLFGFFALLRVNVYGFYGITLSFLYFILVYILVYLKRKSFDTKSVAILGSLSLYLFVFLLLFSMCILTNMRIPYVYELIDKI